MSLYYVRKSGSDSNAGTSAGAAWLTIGKAILAGGMASGDTVYIGAGIYREALTVGFTPSATTYIIGDVDGSQTGDPGEVRWTAYTTNDTTAPAANTLNLNAKSFFSFSNIHFVGGSAITVTSASGSHDLTFTKCAFTTGSLLTGAAAASPISLIVAVDTAANYTFDSCIFGPSSGSNLQLLIQAPTSTIADYNLNIVIKNCEFIGVAGNFGGILLSGTGANTFKPGGITVIDCLFQGGRISQSNSMSLQLPMVVSNCVFHGDSSSQALGASAGSGSIVEDYNLIWYNTPRSNTSIGPYTVASGASSRLLSYGQEAIWKGQPRQFGTPLNNSPMLGFGNAALAVGYAPTVINDATVGTMAWTNPGNASVPDGTFATTALLLNAVSNYLNAQAFTGFAGIPSTATIKSIRVELIVGSAALGNRIKCSSVKLLKAGVITGNDLAASYSTLFTNTQVILTWGNTADPLWGTTWTVAQIQAAGFGFVWAAVDSTAGETCNVDMMRVIVAYTTSDGAGGVATDLLGNPRPAGGNSASYAVGALERGQTATVQSTTARTGSAWQITGPGYHDIKCNVDAVSVTLGVWARYDTASQQPTVTLKAQPELGIAADVALTWSDPGTNTWAQFTTTQVPTAAGVVTIRCATAVGTGIAYFDDFSAT